MLKKTGKLPCLFLFIFILSTSCQTPVINNSTILKQKSTQKSTFSLRGNVEFPESSQMPPLLNKENKIFEDNYFSFSGKAILNEIAELATVSIINPVTSSTVATGLTVSGGAFIITPDAGFTPSDDQIFRLEAFKRAGNGGTGLLSVKTYIKWVAGNWQSITTPTVKINSMTTAFTIIEDFDNSITPGMLINKIDVSSGGNNVTTVGSVNQQKVESVADIVTYVLLKNEDPSKMITKSGAKYVITNPAPIKPEITGFSPASSLAGGTLTINGSGFSAKPENNEVILILPNYGEVTVPVTNVSENQITVTVPNLDGQSTNQAGKVKVVSYGNSDESDNNFTLRVPVILGEPNNFRVNIYQGEGEAYGVPAVSINPADGSFIVIWHMRFNAHLFGLRFDSNANPIGGEFPINNGESDGTRILTAPNGDFVVAWTDYDQRRYARIYKSNGDEKVGTFLVADMSSAEGGYGEHHDWGIGMDRTNGDFIIMWARHEVNHYPHNGTIHLEARKYDINGNIIRNTFEIDTTNQFDGFRQVDIGDDGRFVTTWVENDNGIIYGKLFAQNGDVIKNKFQVNTFGGEQREPDVKMDSSGKFVVAFATKNSGQPGNDQWDVYYRRYDSGGNALDPVQIPVNQTTGGEQRPPTLGMAANGDFVISWDSNGNEIYGRKFNSDGSPLTPEFRANANTGNSREFSTVGINRADGSFIIAWGDNSREVFYEEWGFSDYLADIFASRYDTDGNPL